MEVNWLTVLNTVLNVEVWIKGNTEGKRREGFTWNLEAISFVFCFVFFFPVIYHRSGLHNRILPTMFFSPVEILLPEYQRLGSAFFHPPFPLSFQPLISPSYPPTPPPTAASFLSYPIFCRLPGFIPQQWGWKLHFSWNVSCCKAPAGVIFFFFLFFAKVKNIRLHLPHFMYVNQNSDAHLLRPARRCVQTA